MEAMTVKKLMHLLRRAPPEATVQIAVDPMTDEADLRIIPDPSTPDTSMGIMHFSQN